MPLSTAIPLAQAPSRSNKDRRAIPWKVFERDRSKLHWERKIYHLLMGLVCFVIYAFLVDRLGALLLLGGIGGVLILFDLSRFRFPAVNRLVLKLFGKVMRREELKSLSANTFYIFGLFLIVWFFPRPIVLLSILFLAVGDPAAAVVGTLVGRHRIFFGKSVEGALANLGVSFLATLATAFLYFHLPMGRALWLSLVGGTVSMIAEVCPLPVDDNFTVPVVSGILLTLVNQLFPIL